MKSVGARTETSIALSKLTATESTGSVVDDPGTEYELFPGLVERIDSAAFDSAIQADDVRALVNHDPNQLIGRSAAGTLRLSVDNTGLRYEIDLPDTSAGRDVRESVSRGDLDGSSFSFVPERIETEQDGERQVRRVMSVRLMDVGPVAFPAYEGSTVAARAIGDTSTERDELDNYLRQRRRKRSIQLFDKKTILAGF